MTGIPTDIFRTDKGLTIQWSDGLETTYTARQLRDACPCATCREHRSEETNPSTAPEKSLVLPVLSAAESRPLHVLQMKPVGHYAYGIEFSDGHDSGLFTFDYLRDIQPLAK